MSELKNYMEHLVSEELEGYLNEKNLSCSCDRCVMDMKAYALNKLPPLYIISEKGYIYEKINEMRLQFKVDILKAIVEAVETVSKNPRHGDRG